MFDFLDFNGNGELDPMEMYIGATIASGVGYGAGLSADEEYESSLREKYEDELDRKQRRIDELEEELEDLRESRDRYWDDDDDDYDDGWIDIGYEGDGRDDRDDEFE